MKIQQILQMLQNLQFFAKFKKNQLDVLVDFDKCCKTRIYLQRSAPIQPKTSEILPKFAENLATTPRVHCPGPLPIEEAARPGAGAPAKAAGAGGAKPGTSSGADLVCFGKL